MTGEVPTSDMHFCGDPTADFDEAGIHLRTWYEANCPELHLGGWRAALCRGIRRVLFGYRDYDTDRDRHRLMLGLINEVGRIERERHRQVSSPPFAERMAIRAEAQMVYWRRRMAAEKCFEDGMDNDGNYTPIGEEAAYQSGYVNGRLSEAEWWQKTILADAAASGIAARSDAMRSSAAEGESPVGNAETPPPEAPTSRVGED